MSSGFFGFEEIPSSQPEEQRAYLESEEESVSAGSPELEGERLGGDFDDEQNDDEEEGR